MTRYFLSYSTSGACEGELVVKDSEKRMEARVAVFECEVFTICLLEAEKIDGILCF